MDGPANHDNSLFEAVLLPDYTTVIGNEITV